MAIRREKDPRDERPEEHASRPDDAATNALPVIGQPRVREDVLEIGRQVIAEDRRLLERLAAYDRGQDAGR